jgi:hypothetical protein
MSSRPIELALLSFLSIAVLSCAARPPHEVSTILSSTPGQGEYARVIGRVIDATKEPIPGVQVTLSTQIADSRGTASSIDGEFVFEMVPPGTYDLLFNGVGYESIVSKGVVIEAGANLKAEAVLEPGGVIIELIDPPPMVRLRETSVGVVIINDDNGFPRVEKK